MPGLRPLAIGTGDWLTILAADLQLHRVRCGAHVRVVILIDARLEGAGADGVLGAQADTEGYRLLGRERVEVEDRMGCGERELLQAASPGGGGLFLEGVQIG